MYLQTFGQNTHLCCTAFVKLDNLVLHMEAKAQKKTSKYPRGGKLSTVGENYPGWRLSQ
jgi:hypothetical protein